MTELLKNPKFSSPIYAPCFSHDSRCVPSTWDSPSGVAVLFSPNQFLGVKKDMS